LEEHNDSSFRAEGYAKQKTKNSTLLVAYSWLVSQLTYSLTLDMEAVHFPKMLMDFHQTTQHYISNDSTVHDQPRENLKFDMS
jgi:hypothetical protein